MKGKIFALLLLMYIQPSIADDTLVSGGEVLAGTNEAVAALALMKEAAKAANEIEEEMVKYIENKPNQARRIKNAAKAMGNLIFGAASPGLHNFYMYENAGNTGYAYGRSEAEFAHHNLPKLCERSTAGICRWNWNDKASSVKTNGRTVFVGYEHANYGGSRLIIGPNQNVNLHAIGWGDRISSIIVKTGSGALADSSIFP